jgi:hypothetical protein
MKGQKRKKLGPRLNQAEKAHPQALVTPRAAFGKAIVAMLTIVLKNPVVAHPMKISAAVGGEIVESWALRVGHRLEIPDLALTAFDKTTKFLLLLLLAKWVADALIDTWIYLRDRLR